MALPADTRRRWNLTDGGAVEVADLGNAIVIVPAEGGGMRQILRDAIDDAGGYGQLVTRVGVDEPELA